MKWWRISAASLLACSAAQAQFITGFEPPAYTASPNGEIMTAQDGWYIPPVPPNPLPSTDFKVFTYDKNALGISVNPTGEGQFVAGQFAQNLSARAQRDVPIGTGLWTFAYDFNAHFTGTAGGTNNIGSFSLQPNVPPGGPLHRAFIALNTFANPAAPTGWNAHYNVFNAAGAALATMSPGAAWNNLVFNHWYRQSTTVDFDSNRIVEVALTDLTTNETALFNPADWFLDGGQDNVEGLPLPTAVRLFASGNAFNIMSWDNLSIIPAPGTAALLALGLAAGARRRRP